MASTIRIAVLADTSVATKNVRGFADSTEQAANRVVTSLGDSKLQGNFGRLQERFDVLDTRAMGFRDTITGLQDSFTGVQALFGQGEAASKSFGDKLLLVGMGVGDLASGMANFLLPLAAVAASLSAQAAAAGMSTTALIGHKIASAASAVATGALTAAQWLLNAALTANPIGIVIVAIVALVAAIVVAYKKSETFRAIVQAVWAAIKSAVLSFVNWFKANIPNLLTVATTAWNGIKRIVSVVIAGITAYIRAYMAVATAVWNTVKSAATTAWNGIRSAISTAINAAKTVVRTGIGAIKSLFTPTLLLDAGRKLINGLINGIKSRIDAAVQMVRDGVNKIKGLLPGSPIKWGPLKSWNNGGAGKRLMGLLEQGITAGSPGVSAALSDGITADSRIEVAGRSAREQQVVLSIDSSGSRTDDLLLELLRKSIRVRGGNVQTVLGRP